MRRIFLLPAILAALALVVAFQRDARAQLPDNAPLTPPPPPAPPAPPAPPPYYPTPETYGGNYPPMFGPYQSFYQQPYYGFGQPYYAFYGPFGNLGDYGPQTSTYPPWGYGFYNDSTQLGTTNGSPVGGWLGGAERLSAGARVGAGLNRPLTP